MQSPYYRNFLLLIAVLAIGFGSCKKETLQDTFLQTLIVTS
jgi:hypothetical protein